MVECVVDWDVDDTGEADGEDSIITRLRKGCLSFEINPYSGAIEFGCDIPILNDPPMAREFCTLIVRLYEEYWGVII